MTYNPPTKEDIRAKIKELERRYEAMEHRDQYLVELQAWMTKRKLVHGDLLWMYRQLAPKRAMKAVKSKKPLHPEMRAARGGATFVLKGDPAFMAAIREAREKQGVSSQSLAERVGVSDASIYNWETGRNAPDEVRRKKILQLLGLPDHLGAKATSRSAAWREPRTANSGAPPGE